MQSENYLSVSEEREIFEKMSGKTEQGIIKSSSSYQFYLEKENEKDEVPVMMTNMAEIKLFKDPLNQDFIRLEMRFPSCEDPQLTMLWSNLEKFKDAVLKKPDKVPVFYINLTHIESDKEGKSLTVMAHMVNPVLWYLTRNNPAMLTKEFVADDELHGGNVIVFLISADLFEIEISDDDYRDMKSAILRELDDITFCRE